MTAETMRIDQKTVFYNLAKDIYRFDICVKEKLAPSEKILFGIFNFYYPDLEYYIY